MRKFVSILHDKYSILRKRISTDRYHGMKTSTHRYSRFRDISSGLCKFIDHLDKSEALDTENVDVCQYGNLSIKSTISNQGCDLIACTSLCT